MAPQRPPRAELIFRDGYDPGNVTGVLVSRAFGDEARAMAVRALAVDGGWPQSEAREAIAAARPEPGRFWKTPDRTGSGWILHRAGMAARRGATPGVLFALK